jgi:hypothetical protein
MTRDDFIDGYIARSQAAGSLQCATRTEDGYDSGVGFVYVALPCICGEEGCDGWAMVRDEPDQIKNHMFFRGPMEDRPDSPF